MRTLDLGSTHQGTNWNPRFKAVGSTRSAPAKLGARNTSVMVRFPVIKEGPRTEPLRHYFHRDMAMLLDARHDVLAWTTATEPMPFVANGREREFTPDFRATLRDGCVSIRLLRSGTAADDVAAERHAIVERAYREAGECLQVVSESDLAADPRLPAARELFLHRGRPWGDGLAEAVSEAWAGACPSTLGEIHADIGGSSTAWLELLALAAHGHVRVGLEGNLRAETTVFECSAKGWEA